jgi:hypothetical protein
MLSCLCAGLILCFAAGESEVGQLVARIKAVGREGAGNTDAAQAWKQLAGLDAETLPEILAAFDGADPKAANWLRAAVDAIAERALRTRRPLPAGALESFVHERRHDGAARRIAYEWLTRIDRRAADRLLPGMLDDPGQELRRDAVERVVRQAEGHLKSGDKTAAVRRFQEAFTAARDRDQVEQLAGQLKKLGIEVDVPRHLGIVASWQVIGPFDGPGETGYGRVYPPETEVDPGASYPGKKGLTLRWTSQTTRDADGIIVLNKVLGKYQGAVAYAFTAVDSPIEQYVQIQVGTPNAIKIFVNGKQVFAREEYHHGMQIDQHIGTATLRPGRNTVLLKLCQNEQTEDWAKNWAFQCRICDVLGGAVPLTVLTSAPPSPPANGKAN